MQPNILLITIDCWRFDRLGTLTENLVDLASKGVSFQQAYTNGGWTQAAFPGLLSSTYASMYDGCLGPLSEQRPYLPEWLQKQGYQTLAVQTSPLLEQNFGYGRGMDELVSLQPSWQAPSWYTVKGTQRLLRQSSFHRITGAANIVSRPAPAYANAHEATEQAIKLVQRAHEPFFLWVHYMDAHWPYYDQEGHETPELLAQSWTDRQLSHVAVRKKNRQRPSSKTIKHWAALHDAALRTLDNEIGRLLDAVEQQVGGEVLIVATGDHGEEFYEHGNFGHQVGNLYEEIIHIPLLMVYPQQFAPKIVRYPVALLDIAPTISDLLSTEAPAGMMGDSLLPLIIEDGSNDNVRKPVISECHWGDEAHLVAIRDGEYKFIVDLREPENWQLFNLAQDADEQNDLRANIPEDAPEFGPLLEGHLATVQASKIVESETPMVDDELTARLRELGYID